MSTNSRDLGVYVCKEASPPGAKPITAKLELHQTTVEPKPQQFIDLSSETIPFESNWQNPSPLTPGKYYGVAEAILLGTPIITQYKTEPTVPN